MLISVNKMSKKEKRTSLLLTDGNENIMYKKSYATKQKKRTIPRKRSFFSLETRPKNHTKEKRSHDEHKK